MISVIARGQLPASSGPPNPSQPCSLFWLVFTYVYLHFIPQHLIARHVTLIISGLDLYRGYIFELGIWRARVLAPPTCHWELSDSRPSGKPRLLWQSRTTSTNTARQRRGTAHHLVTAGFARLNILPPVSDI